MDLKGKRVAVVGISVSGKAASVLLRQKGAEVYATDAASSDELKKTVSELKRLGIYTEIGRHTDRFIKKSDLVVVSPGVPDSSAAILMANESAIPIIGEIELASWFCKAPVIAVTGTNGKSTVVTLIGQMLNSSGKNAVVCGNIGEPFCDKVSDLSAEGIAVVEASSFQLKRIRNLRPRVAAITNITQNHFDWHTDFTDYFLSKKNIFRNQQSDDFTIFNHDDSNLQGLRNETHSQVYLYSRYSETDGAFYDEKQIIINMNGKKSVVCRLEDLALKSEHYISNVLCACICASISGATLAAMAKVLREFKGLEHRFQEVFNIDGIKFIDDSKATTVGACRAALSSCKEKIILIAGGRDKGSDFSTLKELVAEKVKALLLIGEARQKIREALGGSTTIYDASDMDEAVSFAWKIAGQGDCILLSPMCSSFDMYRDYKHRGEVFQDAVRRLTGIHLRGGNS